MIDATVKMAHIAKSYKANVEAEDWEGPAYRSRVDAGMQEI
jgi:hypothetical protein